MKPAMHQLLIKERIMDLNKRFNPRITYITEPTPTVICSKRHITESKIS